MPRENRVVYQARAKPHKPFYKRAALILGVLASAAIIFIGFWYGANLSYLRADQIEVNGTQLLPASEIKQVVRDDLSGFFWLVIPRNNFFFISGRRIRDDLGLKFSQLSHIEVDKKFPRKIAITVKEHQLWGVYCLRSQTQPPVSTPCFYLNTRGMAYEELSRFEGWLLPLIYGSDRPKIGVAAVSAEKLQFFGEAKTALEGVNSRLLSMSLSTTTPDDVRLGLAEGWEVWVTATRPVSEWLGALKTLLESEVGEKRFQLEYADLRFGNKIFYKYR